jgi:hypothetical protein
VTLRLERDHLREELQRHASQAGAAGEQEEQLQMVIGQLEKTKRERDMYAWRLLGDQHGTAARGGQLSPLASAQEAADKLNALAEELAEQMAAEMATKFAEEAANAHKTIESLTMALAATKSQVGGLKGNTRRIRSRHRPAVHTGGSRRGTVSATQL